MSGSRENVKSHGNQARSDALSALRDPSCYSLLQDLDAASVPHKEMLSTSFEEFTHRRNLCVPEKPLTSLQRMPKFNLRYICSIPGLVEKVCNETYEVIFGFSRTRNPKSPRRPHTIPGGSSRKISRTATAPGESLTPVFAEQRPNPRRTAITAFATGRYHGKTLAKAS